MKLVYIFPFVSIFVSLAVLSMTLKGSNFILKGDFTMDKINSRRNDGTNGYIPRLMHKRVIKGWIAYRSWKKEFRASK